MNLHRWHVILLLIGMTDHTRESPFYLRFGIILLSLAILAVGLYFGRSILLPFFFGILLAILLLPVTKFLQRLHLGKVASITITILTTVLVLGSLIYFLSTQIGSFLADFPTLEKRFHELLWTAQKWVAENLNIGMRAQREYIDETTEQMKSGSPQMLSKTVLTVTGVISYLVFLPIYAFLILYHKDMIKRFLIEVCKNGDENKVREILQESQTISQQYITGLLIELCIVFALNTAGFLILGIKYAIFLALLSALLNIVPYIGMIIANVICVLVTLMSAEHAGDAVMASVVLCVVQLIDNNILMPLIVGNKVKLNALAIILGVLVSGALAGVAGMFLAIPALAVLKLIFERVEGLKPWAILLGDETTAEEEKKNPVKNVINRAKFRSKVKKKVPTDR
jgi:predicted PurR-regulated permease PerM